MTTSGDVVVVVVWSAQFVQVLDTQVRSANLETSADGSEWEAISFNQETSLLNQFFPSETML